MKSKILAGVLGLSMLLPLAASAATITNPTSIFNGQSQVYGNAGSNAQATFQVDVPAGQVLHAIRTKVDGQATVCKELGPVEGAQVVDVTVDITLPPNTNNSGYTLVADLYYTDTLPQAEAMTGNLACTSSVSGSHVNTAAYSGGTVVNVLPTSGTSTGGSPTSVQSQINALVALVQQMIAAAAHPTPVPPTTSSACTAINTKLASALPGVRTDGNARLQGFLLSEGASIPALSAGASFGFYGNQTAAAVSWFKATNNCQ